MTSELNLDKQEIYRIYHNLWSIEESFHMMKGELDARPVFVKTKNTIYGHFLICYLSTLLIRLLQVHELKYVIVGNKYVNMITNQPLLDRLSSMTSIPLKNEMLTKK